MALETGTYIDSLVSTNPVATDGLSQADDHMRLIKSTIKATFPNVAGAMTLSHTTLNRGAVPVGVIVLWSGAVSAIPTGWAICDGANGTPNLTGRFIVHADADAAGTYNVAGTGGAATDAITTSSNGAHTHTAAAGGDHSHGGTTGTHALTTDELPAHQHISPWAIDSGGDTPYGTPGTKFTVLGGTATEEFGGNDAESADSMAYTSSVGGGTAHSHSITTSGTHTHTTDSQGAHTHTATVDTIPPYYALAYIMRIAD